MGLSRIQFPQFFELEWSHDVINEVTSLISSIWPNIELFDLDNTFSDIQRLFSGEMQGFRECNTQYHDWKHTLDVFLAMARLIHGAHADGFRFKERSVVLGLISALLHDTGYIQLEDDLEGTGAKYTLTHVKRSIDFTRRYFSLKGYCESEFTLCRDCILATDLSARIEDIPFGSDEALLLGQMLGVADIIGQMSTSTYVENLISLFKEFEEGRVPFFESEADLLEKTPKFYAMVRVRFRMELGNADRFMRSHFRTHWKIDRDFYTETIEKHVSYIKYLMKNHKNEYMLHLRRVGIQPCLGAGKPHCEENALLPVRE